MRISPRATAATRRPPVGGKAFPLTIEWPPISTRWHPISSVGVSRASRTASSKAAPLAITVVAGADQRHRKERLIRVFDQRLETLEPGIGEGVLLERHRRLVLRYPAGHSLANLDPQFPQIRGVRHLRSVQHHFVRLLTQEVDQARVASGGLRREAEHLAQNLVD